MNGQILLEPVVNAPYHPLRFCEERGFTDAPAELSRGCSLEFKTL